MGGILLAIDGHNTLMLAHLHQGSQGHFGAIADGAEHGLTKNSTSNANKIQTGYQLAIQPRFNAVCMACLVQGFVGLHHGRHDPGAILSFAGTLRTCLNDLVK